MIWQATPWYFRLGRAAILAATGDHPYARLLHGPVFWGELTGYLLDDIHGVGRPWQARHDRVRAGRCRAGRPSSPANWSPSWSLADLQLAAPAPAGGRRASQPPSPSSQRERVGFPLGGHLPARPARRGARGTAHRRRPRGDHQAVGRGVPDQHEPTRRPPGCTSGTASGPAPGSSRAAPTAAVAAPVSSAGITVAVDLRGPGLGAALTAGDNPHPARQVQGGGGARRAGHDNHRASTPLRATRVRPGTDPRPFSVFVLGLFDSERLPTPGLVRVMRPGPRLRRVYRSLT